MEMNSHHHEVKMNMPQQHDVKISVHTHSLDLKMNMNQNHEVKMNHQHEMMHHDLSDSKMSMQLQHEVKMVPHNDNIKMMHQPHEVKFPQHEVLHHGDVKLNHQNLMHHDVSVQVMEPHHMIDLHNMPMQVPQMETNSTPNNNSVDQQTQHQEQQQPAQQPIKKEKKEKKQQQATAENNKKKKEAIDGQAREVIFKVIKFFESEKQNRGYAFPVENVVKRACAATGLSESTIKRIKRDGLRAEATQTRIPGPKKKRVRKTKVQLDYFQLCALKGIVTSYSNRKEVPTLGKILAAAKHELNYRGGKESLRLILLNKLGIKFKKCEKKNKKPPENEAPPQMQPMQQQVMAPPPMQQHSMKVMENQCVYTNMLPPVSY